MYDFDIIIVGAGPSGCACAIHLANSNLKIAIFDKSIFPRDKICSGGLSDRAINTLKRMPNDLFKRFQNSIPYNPIQNILYVNPTYNTSYFRLPSEHTYVINRIDFDNFLFSELNNFQNITKFENTKINDINIYNDFVEIKTKDKRYTSKIVVMAEGQTSLISKKYNLITTQNSQSWLCTQAFYQNLNFDSKSVGLIYDKNLLPYFFWIFPELNGKYNVGLGITDKNKLKNTNIDDLFYNTIKTNKYLQSVFENANQIGEMRKRNLPIGKISNKISTARALIIGTSALIIDPMSGEGIGNGMLSGEIAALHIKDCFEKNDFSAKQMKNYDIKIYKRLHKEFSRNSFFTKLLSYKKITIFILKLCSKDGWLKKQIEKSLIK